MPKNCPSPDERVPQCATQRKALVQAAQECVVQMRLVPPLTFAALREHGVAVATDAAVPEAADYAMVALHNAIWRSEVATVPFDRRMLLLPPCLHDQVRCQASKDEFGLLCAQCGACAIGSMTSLAENLGYTVMVADNATTAKELVRDGVVDAVVGVSCMETLEKIFPELNTEAVPSFALPLLRCGCRDTTVDTEMLTSLLQIRSGKTAIPSQAIRDCVKALFVPAALEKILGLATTATEKLAQDYLAEDGKRWRPLLMVTTYQALCGCPLADIPERVYRLAVAVECFHKASLIHDDIEDGDTERNGYATLHARTNIATAINTGDLLLGEGYRLIAGSGFSSEVTHEIFACAADGHRQLCLGQGEEMLVQPNDEASVIEIFRRKTSPAFGVALQWGVLCAAADTGVSCTGALQSAIATYSDALGIAYQIRDDIADKNSQLTDPATLLDTYRSKVFASLEPLDCAPLKIFLARLARYILE